MSAFAATLGPGYERLSEHQLVALLELDRDRLANGNRYTFVAQYCDGLLFLHDLVCPFTAGFADPPRFPADVALLRLDDAIKKLWVVHDAKGASETLSGNRDQVLRLRSSAGKLAGWPYHPPAVEPPALETRRVQDQEDEDDIQAVIAFSRRFTTAIADELTDVSAAMESLLGEAGDWLRAEWEADAMLWQMDVLERQRRGNT